MESLINILKKETETLKIQYVEMTETWAKKEYEYLLSSLCDGNTYMVRGIYYPKSINTKKSWYPKISILNSGVTLFVEKSKKNAIQHYEDSVLKLANRIEKKNLNIENLKVKMSHVGVNLEIILTDGVKTVKAFTIIAEGEIQKPHYRYLVK